MRVVGYELLFRSSAEATSASGMTSGEFATATVLVNTLMHFGLQRVSSGKPLYINASYGFLTSDLPMLLPPEHMALEILEDVRPDTKLLFACREWKEMGYTLVLDDFTYAPHLQPLVDMADIIKVDMGTLTPEDFAAEVEQLQGFPGLLLAEKVETAEGYRQARELGFHLFQGYFHCRPELLKKKAIPSSKAHALQVLQRAFSAQAIKDVGELLAKDMALSYQLLKYINSVGLGLRMKVESIGHALSLLGLRNIRVWLSIVVLAMADSDKPQALLTQALLRGRFLELLAERLGRSSRKSDYFILGMFSLLDAILDLPMREALTDIYLPKDIYHGLTDAGSSLGKMLGIAIALERGDWEQLTELTGARSLQGDELSALFVDAASWADDMSAMQLSA